MEGEHTISWDKVPKYRIIQMVPGLMSRGQIGRKGTVVYSTLLQIVGEHGWVRRKLEKFVYFEFCKVPTELAEINLFGVL